MTRHLRILDLFSGAGGFSVAAHGVEPITGPHGRGTWGFDTAAFCEYNTACEGVLKANYPGIPVYPDVRHLDAQALKQDGIGPIDLICGGYPCQPFSLAGQRKGKDDPRHLWPHFARLIAELRPTWVVGENVAGHRTMGLDDVVGDLAALGYAGRPYCISAASAEAFHRRDRVWIVYRRTDAPPIWSSRSAADDFGFGSGSVGLPQPQQPGQPRVDDRSERTYLGQEKTIAEWFANVDRQRGASAADASDVGRGGGTPGVGRLHDQTGGEAANGRNQTTHVSADGAHDEQSRAGGAWERRARSANRNLRLTQHLWRHHWAAAAHAFCPLVETDGLPTGWKLSPEFSEFMMGFEIGTTAGLPKNKRIGIMGNAIVPQVANELFRLILLSELYFDCPELIPNLYKDDH